MKVRLKQPGFENFAGQMGSFQFEDGLSTTAMPERDFLRLSAVMSVCRENGSTAQPIDALLSIANKPAPSAAEAAAAEQAQSDAILGDETKVRKPRATKAKKDVVTDGGAYLNSAPEQSGPEEQSEAQDEEQKRVEQVAPAEGQLYSREQLGQIADESGIKGLRTIATPLGIKGNSIAELIEEILQATNGA